MMRVGTRITVLAFAAVYGVTAFGQNTDNPPAFQIADVHSSAKGLNQLNQGVRGPFLSGGRYDLRDATMVDMIVRAYGIDADKVLEGPNWLEYDRFDVIAKTPPNTSAETAKLMLQSLLADRFKLVIHKDNRPMPAYVLTVGKGKPKLKEAEGSGDTGCKVMLENRQPDPNGGPIVPMLAFTCRNMTMAAFAEGMRNMALAQQYIGTNPVLDKTGLEGAWDFNLKYSLPVRLPPGIAAPSENITLQDALDKQLGLKLDLQSLSLPVIVVASVNQQPTRNAPEVAQKLPPLPSEFDVADLRPVAPDARMAMNIQIQPGGRVNLTGLPLRLMIQEAWQVQNDSIVGAPKWMETDRYDVIAKAPGIAAPSPNAPADFETVFAMLRGLLAERFKLAVHFEDRSMTAYTLVAAKPKLKKADPASRTKLTTEQATGGRGGGPAGPPMTTVTVQNMTLAQFAEKLQFIASTYIHSPVLDATGIEGTYDFTLTYSAISPALLVGAGGRGGDAGPAGTPSAAEPIGGVTLFEALEKQLGLKLTETKRPVSVLVIDHAEQKPTDN